MGNNSDSQEKVEGVEGPFLTSIDPNDPSSHPPSEGETCMMDIPWDCIGVILTFLSETKDILSFMSSCKIFYSYFRSKNDIEKVTFTLNLNRSFSGKPIDIIFRLRCIVVFAENLTNEHFKFFPNLKYLMIERCRETKSEKSENAISTKIFEYLPNLEELHVGGSFYIQQSCSFLSEKIKVLSLRYADPIAYYSGDRGKKPIRNDLRFFSRYNFLSDILLNRPEIIELNLRRFPFNPNKDLEFSQRLSCLKNLKKLVLRQCKGLPNKFILPESLEEFDVSGCTIPETPKFHEIFVIPPGIQKLSLGSLPMNMSEVIEGISEKGVFEKTFYLDISGSTNRVYYERNRERVVNEKTFHLISKVFPNLTYLRATETPFSDKGIDHLKKMKKLGSVRVSDRSIKESLNQHGLTVINRYVSGIQMVGKIKIMVL